MLSVGCGPETCGGNDISDDAATCAASLLREELLLNSELLLELLNKGGRW